jgi:hypothetical protein
MSTVDGNLKKVAGKKVGKCPPPFSLRLSFEERARLSALEDRRETGTPEDRAGGTGRRISLRKRSPERMFRAGPVTSDNPLEIISK